MAKPIYTPEKVDALRSQFAALERPKKPLSTRQLILQEMMPEIEKKLKSGWSYDDLVEGLRQVGITLRANTLRNYVASARSKSSKKVTATRAKTAASKAQQPLEKVLEPSSPKHPQRRPNRRFAGFDESP